MSRIDDLIQELCPAGVERKPLADLLDYEQPTKYLVSDKNYSDSYPTPVLTAGQSFLLGYTEEVEGIYPASSNTPVIIFDDFTTSFHWVNFNFKVKSSAMKMITPKSDIELDFRFAYYAMKVIKFEVSEHARHWISVYSNFRIPLPPLEVQREIVSILDKFTELEAELEAELDAELEARKKQFKYFCDDLYSASYLDLISKNVTKTLGEIGSFTRGNGLQKSDLTSGGAGCIHYGQIFTFYKTQIFETKSFVSNEMANRLKKASKGDLIIATTSENDADVCKAVVWLGSEEIGIGGETYIFRHNLDPLFSAYYFKSDLFQFQKHKKITGTKVRRVHGDAMAKFVIVVPEMQHQILIGQTLSKLESLLESMDSGLPAEIAARRKQYEHYRDQLLTFKELKSA